MSESRECIFKPSKYCPLGHRSPFQSSTSTFGPTCSETMTIPNLACPCLPETYSRPSSDRHENERGSGCEASAQSLLPYSQAATCKSWPLGSSRAVFQGTEMAGSLPLIGLKVTSRLTKCHEFWCQVAMLPDLPASLRKIKLFSAPATHLALCTTFGLTHTKSFCLGTPNSMRWTMRPKSSILSGWPQIKVSEDVKMFWTFCKRSQESSAAP